MVRLVVRVRASGAPLGAAADGVFLRVDSRAMKLSFGLGRKVGEFVQERRAKAYEAGLRKELALRHPHLTQDQAERYERRIGELVAEIRQKQRQPQQEQQARIQEQARGIEQAL